MKYYIIVGEASGDLDASNLIEAIKKEDQNAEFRGIGGDLMQKQGMQLLKHYKESAFMGFLEVVLNLKPILENLQLYKTDIINYKADCVILVDYPGFNLKIAKFAHLQGIKVLYYISPKIWAWKTSRIKQIKQYVNKMFVIFPFEVEFYNKYNYKVNYVGNPLIDSIEAKRHNFPSIETFIEKNNLTTAPIIAMVAGSRKQEIANILPEMLNVISKFPEYQFVIAGAPSIEKEFYQKYIVEKKVKLIFNQTYELMHFAKVGIVTSGTATLEAALLNLPQVVVYKTSKISYSIAKQVVSIKFISLVNLIMNKEVVKEFIQNKLAIKIIDEVNKILNSTDYNKNMLQNYSELQKKLGTRGASEKCAKLICEYLKTNSK